MREQIIEEGFELLVRLQGRSRAPFGWQKFIVGGLQHREGLTEHGIWLSVQTHLRAELDRLRELIYRQPWKNEIVDMWSRQYKR